MSRRQPEPPPDWPAYRDALESEGARLWAVAADRLEATVPQYPEWSVADLIVHVGTVHRWATHILRTKPLARPPQDDMLRIDDPDRLRDWFADGLSTLVHVAAATDPGAPLWTLSGDGRAGFWFRRMTHETMLHRWDAQSVVGEIDGFAPKLAAAAIAESLDIHVVRRLDASIPLGPPLTVAIVSTDTAHAWQVVVQPPAIRFAAGVAADADASIAGRASDLWLLLMGRPPAEPVITDGDREAFERFRALVGLVPSAAATRAPFSDRT